MKQRYLIYDENLSKTFFPQTWTSEGDDLDKVAKKKITKQRIVQILGRIVLPTITAAFVLLYIFVAAYIYNNPKLNYN